MRSMDRTRIIFIAIVGLALAIVVCGFLYNRISDLLASGGETPSPSIGESVPIDLSSTGSDIRTEL